MCRSMMSFYVLNSSVMFGTYHEFILGYKDIGYASIIQNISVKSHFSFNDVDVTSFYNTCICGVHHAGP